jgi:hypothetical protein
MIERRIDGLHEGRKDGMMYKRKEITIIIMIGSKGYAGEKAD